MCGRFVVEASLEDLLAFFGLNGELPGLHAMPPRYNIAPTQPILTVLENHGERHARLMRWAFLPDWVKDPSSFSLLSNARAESAATKPSFRNAIRYRRCIIPASGFYEWKRSEKNSQPYYISSASGEPLAMAALWETWMGPNGEEQDGVAILTTGSNQTMSQIHHRMPVMLDRENFSSWLDVTSGRSDHITHLLSAQREDFLSIHPVAKAVNRIANDHPELLEKVEIERESEEQKSVAKEKSSGQLDLF